MNKPELRIKNVRVILDGTRLFGELVDPHWNGKIPAGHRIVTSRIVNRIEAKYETLNTVYIVQSFVEKK
jgi:hypothetical protein